MKRTLGLLLMLTAAVIFPPALTIFMRQIPLTRWIEAVGNLFIWKL